MRAGRARVVDVVRVLDAPAYPRVDLRAQLGEPVDGFVT